VANRSLTGQFTSRLVRKKYLLITDSPMKRDELVVKSKIVRAGERYVSGPQGEPAETRFKPLGAPASRRQVTKFPGEMPSLPDALSPYHVIEAEPLTGRTHQIRVHAAEAGFPIMGDALY
jgi:23S rRNA-/tRNA-specific pseudouridylate synthase